jgi:hypothetical protein
MTQPNDPDPWPRYVIFDHALKLSKRAAQLLDVAHKPTKDWTKREVLLVALMTEKEERDGDAHRSDDDPGRGSSGVAADH